MHIHNISDFRAAIRHGAYAWPGGYPLYFIMADGAALSFKAAKTERRQMLDALAHGDMHDSWRPTAVDINWEDTELTCDHTGERIQSAYGDEDA